MQIHRSDCKPSDPSFYAPYIGILPLQNCLPLWADSLVLQLQDSSIVEHMFAARRNLRVTQENSVACLLYTYLKLHINYRLCTAVALFLCNARTPTFFPRRPRGPPKGVIAATARHPRQKTSERTTSSSGCLFSRGLSSRYSESRALYFMCFLEFSLSHVVAVPSVRAAPPLDRTCANG